MSDADGYGGPAPPRHETSATRPGTDIRAGGLLDRSDIEAVIVRYADGLEDATSDYAKWADLAAAAEADWKAAFDAAILAVDADPDNRPGDAKTREAKARQAARTREEAARVTGDPDAGDLYRTHLIFDGRLSAAKVQCTTLEKRLDAYRTLAANVRAQT